MNNNKLIIALHDLSNNLVLSFNENNNFNNNNNNNNNIDNIYFRLFFKIKKQKT
jgi:hypothetical protein